MNKISYIILLIIFCLVGHNAALSQSKTDLENKKKKTLEEISYTNKLLKQTKESQKESYNSLLLISKNINSRKELIQNINDEVSYYNERVLETELIITIMQDDLEILKQKYANMIKVAWKNQNKYNDIMFILSADDFNQTYLRLKYMQQLAEFRKKQFMAINSVKAVLEIQIAKLNEAKLSKTRLLNEEKKESQKLTKEQQNKESTLANLKSQEQELKNKLQEQQKQMAQLQREIEKLIAEEAKRSSGSKTGKYELTPAEKIVSTNFDNNKGRLPWPVERGVITSSFGKQNHPILRNVTLDNKGIDITTTTGSTARAVFDGEVRKVISIPGAQNAVIIRHGQYLSVYTNLDDVYVSVGEMVVTKQSLGIIHTDKSENKTVLHFEIWKVSTPMNPSYWLAN
ncbi:MAG: peptidoglycan DD-metalloendopeptidase family protein [Bacteroidales bacterium]|nr:peptidoglycan DD-metalloendopeptidase family protein [Bacteroidales bacterium]MDD4217446.1 peptidoglycan DD-metalloendopeptidase family protein [Bacteroidales bacterium]MDY0141941.1 peptidoglycan DD-metalloendopeptidase family protein [Bacteroidales bacterium]